MLIDLDGNAGAKLVGTAPHDPPRSMRFCYPGKLATSVRGRLKRLASGASPAELQLGHDTSVESCTVLLSHLDALWYQLPRSSPTSPPAWQELVTGGVQAAYFRVGGRTFGRQDASGRLTFQGAQYLQTLDALTDYDRFREDAERDWPWERWQGTCEWPNAVLARSDHGRYRWFLDQLVVARDDELRTPGLCHARVSRSSGRIHDLARVLERHAQVPCGPTHVTGLRRRASDTGRSAVGRSRGSGDDDRASSHFQSGPSFPVDGPGTGT